MRKKTKRMREKGRRGRRGTEEKMVEGAIEGRRWVDG